MISALTKRFQSGALTVYRVLSFFVLSSIIFGVLGYVCFLVFYLGSTSWASPITLSPAQDRVLTFQPQVASLEAQLEKQKIDLDTAIQKLASGRAEVLELKSLITRMQSAQKSEASTLKGTASAIAKTLSNKRIDIESTDKAIANVNSLLKKVDDELAAGLITFDQALEQRISLQTALNTATDSKTQLLQLESTVNQMNTGADTLRGGNSSITVLVALQQAEQLKALEINAEIENHVAEMTISSLKKAVSDNERVLEVAKSSPYYKALTESVTVLFVPYSNLNHAKIGEPVYDCYFQIFACSKTGVVTRVYEAEEYARHPLFKTDLKGRFVGIKIDPESAKSQVLFIGGKPLFL